MRTWLPLFAILLALIAAGCIAYIAWELTSGNGGGADKKPPDDSPEQSPD